MTKIDVWPEDHPLLDGYVRPKMMAIGDSIFNGVRSVMINAELATLSPPAQVAAQQDWPFIVPDYPREVLLHLENEVRNATSPSTLPAKVIENADEWFVDFASGSPTSPAGRRFFDNISIAASEYHHLHTLTAGTTRTFAQFYLSQLKVTQSLDFRKIAELWFHLNSTFLLNPSNIDEIDELSPIEQVATRRPERLFINIGPNEGLFSSVITANYDNEAIEKMERIPDLADELGSLLAEHCPSTNHFYFNLLIRPRTIANLAPRQNADMDDNPGHGYFKKYLGRLGSMGGIDAASLRDFDNRILEINAKTQSRMRHHLHERVHFVDLYEMANSVDAKHFGDARSISVKRGGSTWRLTNEPFSYNSLGLFRGGMFGLDNMHPTAAGYAVLANKMLSTISVAESIPVTPIDIQSAFDADTLLANPPSNWETLMTLFSFIIDLGLARKLG